MNAWVTDPNRMDLSQMGLLDKPVLTVEEAAQVLRVGKAAAYEAVRQGQIPVIRIGQRKLRVPTAKLLEMLGTTREEMASQMTAEVETSEPGNSEGDSGGGTDPLLCVLL